MSIRALRVAYFKKNEPGAFSLQRHAMQGTRVALERYFGQHEKASTAVQIIMEELAGTTAITGSFALHVLTRPTDWKPQDLDISVLMLPNTSFLEISLYKRLVKHRCFQKFRSWDGELVHDEQGTWGWNNTEPADYEHGNDFMCRTTLCAGKKVQFLIMYDTNVKACQDHIRNFDLSVCKNWIGFGNTVHLEHIEDVQRCIAHVNMEHSYRHTMIDHADQFQRREYLVQYLQAKRDRLEKYASRGYRIHCSFDLMDAVEKPLFDEWYGAWCSCFRFLEEPYGPFTCIIDRKRQRLQ